MLICPRPKIFDVDLIGIGVLIVFAAAFWWGVEKNLTSQTRRTHQSYQKLRKQETDLQNELQHLERLDQQQHALALRLSQSPDVLDQNRGLPEVIRQLGQLAHSHHFLIKELTPIAAQQQPYFTLDHLDFQCRSTYPDVYRFIHEINVKAPFLRVVDITIRTIPNQSDAVCDVTMKLHVFAHGE